MPFLKLGSDPEARIKVACAACIRGHRASLCDHTNCPLIEVKRPGRPQVNHVSLPLNGHPCRDGMARTWTVNDNKQHLSDEFRQNAKNYTFKPDEISAAAPQQYPKAKPKKTGARRRTVTTPEDSTTDSIPDCCGASTSSNSVKLQETKPVPSCCSGKAAPQASLPEFSSIRPLAPSVLPQPQPIIDWSSFADPELTGLPPGPLALADVQDHSDSHIHYHHPTFNLSTSTLPHSSPNSPLASVGQPTTPNFVSMNDLVMPSIHSSSASSTAQNSPFPTSYSSRCICGNSCNCLGCPQHPHNPRTTRHVNDVSQYMATDPLYNPEGYLSARRAIHQRLLISRPDLSNLDEETDWIQLVSVLQTESPVDHSFFSSSFSQDSNPQSNGTEFVAAVEHSYQALFHEGHIEGLQDFSGEDIVGFGGLLDEIG